MLPVTIIFFTTIYLQVFRSRSNQVYLLVLSILKSHMPCGETMARPILLAFPVFLLLVHVAAYSSPAGRGGQSALLLNNIVYVCGGLPTSKGAFSNFYTLNVSIPWSVIDPAWKDQNGNATNSPAPETVEGTIFPASDKQSFYLWGYANTSAVQSIFAQYTLASNKWSSPTITNTPMPKFYLFSAPTSSSGIAYFWGGGYVDSKTSRLLDIYFLRLQCFSW